MQLFWKQCHVIASNGEQWRGTAVAGRHSRSSGPQWGDCGVVPVTRGLIVQLPQRSLSATQNTLVWTEAAYSSVFAARLAPASCHSAGCAPLCFNRCWACMPDRFEAHSSCWVDCVDHQHWCFCFADLSALAERANVGCRGNISLLPISAGAASPLLPLQGISTDTTYIPERPTRIHLLCLSTGQHCRHYKPACSPQEGRGAAVLGTKHTVHVFKVLVGASAPMVRCVRRPGVRFADHSSLCTEYTRSWRSQGGGRWC